MELVTLLADDGSAVGSAPKAEIHHEDTPLHLAFSCYVLDDHGRLLLSRRALDKLTWPGVWTNSFCGHPDPDETVPEAIDRRATEELGVTVRDVRVALPDFRYRAVDASGVVENEICPVYVARLASELAPNPDEVIEWGWADVADVAQAVRGVPFAFSPWFREQLPMLLASGGL